jgi:hypothetical protein
MGSRVHGNYTHHLHTLVQRFATPLLKWPKVLDFASKSL